MNQSREHIYPSLILLALPILVGQLGMIATGFADNVMVGRYHTDALAAASFVNSVFNTALMGVVGFSYGLTPLAGALFTRRAPAPGENARDIGRTVRAAFVANTAFTALAVAVMTILYFNLHHLGQPAHLLPLIRPYYLLMLAGMIPVFVFNVLAQWSYAINNTRMPMWIILTANAVNVALNYLLIYGHLGLPQCGLTGAGIATLTARTLCAATIAAIFFVRPAYRAYARGFNEKRIWRPLVRKVNATSLPVASQMIFETVSFSLSGIMAGWLGAVQLAAFQIILSVGTLGFCVYYAIGSAVAVKVSNAAGDGGPARMRRTAHAGYMVMLATMVIACLVFVVAGRHLMAVFTPDTAVIAAATALIPPLLLYQLGDATQINFANALRGTSRVMPMVWIAFVSYVIIGIPATYIMAFTLDMGLPGIIYSYSVSLFVAGALFLIYFLRATRPTPTIP